MRLLTAVFMVLLAGATIYVKQDRLSKGNFTIYDSGWNRVGHITQDRINPDKFDVYDKDWNRRGHIRKENSKNYIFQKD